MAAIWVRAELRRRWRALVALTVLVGLAGGVILAATAGARRTVSAFDRMQSTANATVLDVQLNKNLSGELDEDMGAGLTIRQIIERIRAMPQVEDISLQGFFAVAPPDTFLGFDFAAIAPLDDRTGRVVDRLIVKAGRLPRAGAINEVAVSTSEAKKRHLEPGDTITFASRSADQVAKIVFENDTSVLEQEPDGPTLPMRVVGVISHPKNIGKADLVTPYGYLTAAFYERYRNEIGVFAPTVGVRLRHGYADVPAVSAAIRRLAGPDDEVNFDDNRTDVAAVENGLRVQGWALLAFAVAALLATAVAVGQAFSRQLAQSAEDGPVLRTLGLTRRQRATAMVALGAPVVMGGSVLAVAVAVAASPLLPVGLAREAEPNPGVQVDVLVHVFGAVALAGLLAVLAGSSAWRASRVRASAPVPARLTLGARLAGRMNSGAVTGTGLRMAFDPRPGVPVRSAITGAVAAVVALVAVLTFGASLRNLITHPALAGFPWHADVEGGEETATLDEPVAAAVADRDIDAVTIARFVADVQVNGSHLHAAAARSAKGSAGFTVLTGRAPVGPDEIALGPETMRRLHVSLGDSVRANGSNGRNGRNGTFTMRVVGTVLIPVVDSPDYNDGALLSFGALEKVGSSGYVVELVRFRPGVDIAAKRGTLADDGSLVKAILLPAVVKNLDAAKNFPQALAAFLALLGMGAVTHVLLLSGRRWRKDLAVLRGLGMVRRQAARCITVQAAALGVVAVLVGVPLGIAAGRWAWTLMARSLDVVQQPTVPVAIAVLAPAAVLAVVLASVVPTARAARLAPAAVLRTE
jgi:hypothetical protein